MTLPLPLDPYVYRSYLGRAVDGDTVLQHISLGFGTWVLGSKWPGGPDAKSPQGRYRLNGIGRIPGRGALERVNELAASATTPGLILTKTTKHKSKYLVDLFVRQSLPPDDPIHKIDVESERKHWLAESELLRLIEEFSAERIGDRHTVRAMATEVLWSRRALSGFAQVVHVNHHLLEEGLASPHGRTA